MSKHTLSRHFAFQGLRALLAVAALGLAFTAQAVVKVNQVFTWSDGDYTVGDEIIIAVEFVTQALTSGNITVTPNNEGAMPYLNLTLSPTGPHVAVYVTHYDNIIEFSYRVQPGDFTALLTYPGTATASSALVVPAGTGTTPVAAAIRDADDNALWLYTGPYSLERGLPPPGTANSLAGTSVNTISTMSLVGPPSILHGQTASLTLSRGGALATSLSGTVYYPAAVDNPTASSLFTIPANADSVAVPIRGAAITTTNVFIRARPNSYPADGSGDAQFAIAVVPQVIHLSGPSSVNFAESVLLTLRRDLLVSTPLTVGITYPAELTGPASVTIPANADSVTFAVSGVARTSVPVDVVARPSATGYDASSDATHTMSVLGDDPYLLLSGGQTVLDEGFSTLWTVQRLGSTPTNVALTVTLLNMTPAFIGLSETTVQIPANRMSADFTVYGLDGLEAGSGAEVQATAPGFVPAIRRLTVMNVAPVITAANVSPLAPTITEPVSAYFNATDVLADQATLEGTWIWGDNATTTGVAPGTTVTHAYAEAGTYTVTLIVRDKDNGSTQYTTTWNVAVNAGFNLTVTVPGIGYMGLGNVGSGTVSFSPAPAVLNIVGNTYVALFRQSQTAVRLTATPFQPDADGFDNYVYRIFGDGLSEDDQLPLAGGATHTNVTVQVVMGEDRSVTVLFSREWLPGDNRGDIDGDGLTDEWELQWALNPESTVSPNGGGGCPSGDRMPNAPNLVLENPAELDPSGQPPSGPFGYPIPWTAAWSGYAPVGPFFHNRLQFRGQTLDIWDADRPNTDPNVLDSNGDGLSDGWQYYFYANAINFDGVANSPEFIGYAYDPATLTVGIVIPNDEIRFLFNPAYDRGLAGSDPDNDGLTTLEEFYLGTNPIHWDTDGDGMPDGWEVLYGLDPLNFSDGIENPDQDFMAYANEEDTEYIHGDVYDRFGYDPRTGWAPQVFQVDLVFRGNSPNTRPYRNIDEYLSMRWRIDRGTVPGGVIPPAAWLTYGTDPLSPDTDLDRMPDGWELYVGLEPANPLDNTDGPLNRDADALTNMQEFRCRGAEAFYDAARIAAIMTAAEVRRLGSIRVFSPAYRPDGWLEAKLRGTVVLASDHFGMFEHADWLNKFWPTDPNNRDTDRDQITDSAEYDLFRYALEGVTGTRSGRCYVGGGLNPTSADTDGDWLPDYWEAFYSVGNPTANEAGGALRVGMDGTFIDATDDYDADGLTNYQEYLTGATWHFHYDKWVPGRGYGVWDPVSGTGGYDPIQFFLPAREFAGQNFGEAPHRWDWAFWFNQPLGIRFFFQLAEVRNPPPLTILKFANTHPSRWDSDGDAMDDFYELFHGLNPLWAANAGGDIVNKPWARPPIVRDARVQAWQVGDQHADPDQDGLPNWEEALHPNRVDPQPYHTDPTPYWFTDMSYSESFVNLYYQFKTLANGGMFYWGDYLYPPSYMFTFETNDGYDTDNDNISDKRELIGSDTPGSTDPLDFNDPHRRVALYLNGNGAARTLSGFQHSAEVLRTWTVELWMRPEQLATGQRQILVERPIPYGRGDPLPSPESVRRNFRLGIDEEGRVFVEYDNDGSDLLTQRAKADQKLVKEGVWHHVAGVFTGTRLNLYINGELHGSMPTQVLPANGHSYGNIDLYVLSPIIVGAADSNPSGRVHGGIRYLNGDILPAPSQPVLHSFFRGHVDEVRIWDGARSEGQINAAMNTALFRPDVLAIQQARLADPTAATILYHYNFSTLPDPAYDPISPDGFAALNGRPDDGSYPGIPWWRHAADRSTVYDDYLYVPWIENTVAHVSINPPMDSVYWSNFATGGQPATNVFPNTTNPYGHGYTFADSMFTEWNPDLDRPDLRFAFNPSVDRLYNNLLPLRGAVADRSVPLWDNGTPGVGNFDSNGDGIPDWWYILHGYDPYGPSIAHLDPDGDDLNNLGEFLAGTNPFSSDTDGDGILDYDERSSNPADDQRTFGERFSDGDYVEDDWEERWDLSFASPFRYDEHLDLDGDGWSNWAERRANTRPDRAVGDLYALSGVVEYPEPILEIELDYNGILNLSAVTPNLVVHAYTDGLMNGRPDAVYNLPLNQNVANDPSGGIPFARLGRYDGRDEMVGRIAPGNLAPLSVTLSYLNLASQTLANFAADDGQGRLVQVVGGVTTVVGSIDYGSGNFSINFKVFPPGRPRPVADDMVYAGYRYEIRISSAPVTLAVRHAVPNQGWIREGKNFFHAFLDLNSDGIWQPGEPSAVADNLATGTEVGWDSARLRFGLSDNAPSYARFDWTQLIPAGDVNPRTVTISRSSGTTIFTKTFPVTRTWLHEGDIMAGKTSSFGLDWGATGSPMVYQWRLDGVLVGSFTNVYATTLAVPDLDYPKGAWIKDARPQFRWRMEREATEFDIEIRRHSASGTVVYSGRHQAPSRRRAPGGTAVDYCVWTFPHHAGDILPNGQVFDNDSYVWRLKAYSPKTVTGTAWSEASFRLDVQSTPTEADGRGWMDIGVKYPSGYALVPGGTNRIRVQAFRTRSFNGVPDAQRTISDPGTVRLAGLVPGTYYVRAFVDQDNNRSRSVWESYGYYRNVDVSTEPFRVAGVEARTVEFGALYSVTIRDCDTDQDQIPDSLEYRMHGAGGGDWLSKAGPGPVVSSPAYSDYDGDGINDLAELVFGSDPMKADADGDGIPDLMERRLGFNPNVAEELRISMVQFLQDDVSLQWAWMRSTDVGLLALGVGDDAAVQFDEPVVYVIQRSDSLSDPTWIDVGRKTNSLSIGECVVEPGSSSTQGFYRVLMMMAD